MTTFSGTFSPSLGNDAVYGASRSVARHGLSFGLFILLTGVLFVRPAEIIESWRSVPLYLIVLSGCLLTTAVAFCAQLRPRHLAGQPATVCVIAFLVVIVISQLRYGRLGEALYGFSEFGKTVIYFVLLMAVVDSPDRLRRFIGAIAWLILGVAVLALLQYHGFVHLDTLDALQQGAGYDDFGEAVTFVRLQATGLFSDPNDFSLALCTALIIFGHRFLTTRGLTRMSSAAIIPILGYAFMMTRSRGGFLGLLAAVVTYTVLRSGWKRAILWSLVLLPVIAVAFAGRQTSIDLNDSSDTAQGRILLWREGLQLFRRAPLFGVGFNRYAEEVGQVAHNSYVNCFGDLGFLGGTVFVGIPYCLITSLRRAGAARGRLPAPLRTLLPCVCAILAGYLVGMCSLSRQYALPTYAILGAATAFCSLAAELGSPLIVERLSRRLVWRVVMASVVVLVFFDCFVRVFAV